jgi:hypothetical protein
MSLSSQHTPDSHAGNVEMESAHQYPPRPSEAKMSISLYRSLYLFLLIIGAGRTGQS